MRLSMYRTAVGLLAASVGARGLRPRLGARRALGRGRDALGKSWSRLTRGLPTFWLVLGAAAVLIAAAVQGVERFGPAAHRSSWAWLLPHRSGHAAWSGLGGLLGGLPRPSAPLALGLCLCALAALQRGSRDAPQQFRRAPARRAAQARPTRAQPLRPAAPAGRPPPGAAPSDPELVEKEARETFERIRGRVKQREELPALIDLEAWGEGGRPGRPLKRAEVQTLLEEAARHGRQLSLLRALAAELVKLGVPLDWAEENDCQENLGRHALDMALEVGVGENPSGQEIAMLLLDLYNITLQNYTML